MFVNGIHQWPVIKRFLTWSTSDHLFPWCRNVPRRSVKTSGCISIHWFTWQLLLLLLVDTIPPYILQSVTATFYMLTPEFAVQYHPYPSCSVGTFWDQSLISVIRCIFQHHWQFICDIQTCTCSTMIRWSIMYFTVIYTCILSGSACTWYADMLYFAFSEHGYARLKRCFFLIFFCGLAGWLPVKYSSAFGRFPFHLLA